MLSAVSGARHGTLIVFAELGHRRRKFVRTVAFVAIFDAEVLVAVAEGSAGFVTVVVVLAVAATEAALGDGIYETAGIVVAGEVWCGGVWRRDRNSG